MVTLLGSLILALGALFGIWLGAYYASGRLGAQLDAQAEWFEERHLEEARRFEAQLEAESNRLDRQLEHDRQMRDRDELRRIFDEATTAMEAAVIGTSELLASQGVVKLVNKSIHEHIVTDGAPIGPQKAALAAAYGMGTQHHRLRLRLFKHEITDQYWKIRKGIMSILDQPALGDLGRSEEERKELAGQATELRRDAGIFVRMAYEYLCEEESRTTESDHSPEKLSPSK